MYDRDRQTAYNLLARNEKYPAAKWHSWGLDYVPGWFALAIVGGVYA